MSQFPSRTLATFPPSAVILSTAKDPRILHRSARRLTLFGHPLQVVAGLVLVLLLSPHLYAQGCAQCLDATRATPPQVQAAYRHAIFLLIGVALALFLAGTALLRSNRR